MICTSKLKYYAFYEQTYKKCFYEKKSYGNTYSENRSDNSKHGCTKQFCVAFKKNKNNYANLNERDLNGNKKCWRTVKPLLSHKIKSSGKISLVEQKETS